jgi:DNA-binding MarR family transcriptional regulator
VLLLFISVTSDGFSDPTLHSLWRPLRLLQTAVDTDIARVYAEAQISGLRPSHALVLLRLHARGPMTITALARSVQLTHSAVSQKVAAMRTEGWVRTTAGTDARSKTVELTAKATGIAGRLAAEWRATEAALAEIEAEIPYPLSRAVTDIEQALRRKSFHDRIADRLADDPAWTPAPHPDS